MYDIESKYKKLMTIASGKCPKFHEVDKSIKYRCIGSRFWDAKVIIQNCKDDEKEMLRIWILHKRELVKQEKAIIDLINVALVIFTLMVSVCAMIVDSMEISFQKDDAVTMFACIMIPAMIYLLIYVAESNKISKTINRTSFLLDLIGKSNDSIC